MGITTQEDPIGVAGGVNLYAYGEGDPVNNSDPFGLCPTCPLRPMRPGALIGAVLNPVGRIAEPVADRIVLSASIGAGNLEGSAGLSTRGLEPTGAVNFLPSGPNASASVGIRYRTAEPEEESVSVTAGPLSIDNESVRLGVSVGLTPPANIGVGSGGVRGRTTYRAPLGGFGGFQPDVTAVHHARPTSDVVRPFMR